MSAEISTSILVNIKKMLNIHEDHKDFDQDIIININSTFMVLSQLGIGPIEPFYITDESQLWTDFIHASKNYEGIKTYIYLKVRQVFDSPQNAFLVDAMERQIKELEWRLIAQAERPLDSNYEPIDPEDPSTYDKTETFVHVQGVASNRWIIEHDLEKFPSVTVVDTGNSVVYGEVEYLNKHTVRLRFNYEFSGTAYLN